MFIIGKEIKFSAAHHLPQMPAGHQCARIHGHNYRVFIQLAKAHLGEDAMVFDFGELAPLRDWIDATLDHQNLNEVWEHPTAEVMAYELAGMANHLLDLPPGVRVRAVTVWETDTCYAEYWP